MSSWRASPCSTGRSDDGCESGPGSRAHHYAPHRQHVSTHIGARGRTGSCRFAGTSRCASAPVAGALSSFGVGTSDSIAATVVSCPSRATTDPTSRRQVQSRTPAERTRSIGGWVGVIRFGPLLSPPQRSATACCPARPHRRVSAERCDRRRNRGMPLQSCRWPGTDCSSGRLSGPPGSA